jgi:hypothetical protein
LIACYSLWDKAAPDPSADHTERFSMAIPSVDAAGPGGRNGRGSTDGGYDVSIRAALPVRWRTRWCWRVDDEP